MIRGSVTLASSVAKTCQKNRQPFLKLINISSVKRNDIRTVVWICHFYDLISRLLLSFNFDRGDISKTRECFITFNSEHLEFHPKFSAAAAFFNSLLGVWKCDETHSLVFNILSCYSISSKTK